MPIAEIITIGTEILLGEIDDTNATFLSRRLNELGISVYRKTSIGDNVQRIASLIQETLTRCDIIITTGGLGPTVDDPTREALALAWGTELQFHPELWEQIKRHLKLYNREPTENNRRQAYLPITAIPVENPVGTAPAFILSKAGKTIACLPGVPQEMKYLMDHTIIPFLKNQFDLQGLIKTRVLHTVGIGESLIDTSISDFETLSNPTVGLAAHAGQVDIRITVKANSLQEAEQMIRPIEIEIHNRLKDHIYATDEVSLEQVAMNTLRNHNWRLIVCEHQSHAILARRLEPFSDVFIAGEILTSKVTDEELVIESERFKDSYQVECALGISVHQDQESPAITIYLSTPDSKTTFSRPYGGAPQSAAIWGVNHALDILRKL